MLEKGVASHLSPRQSYASNYTVDSFMTPREFRSCRVTEFNFKISSFFHLDTEYFYILNYITESGKRHFSEYNFFRTLNVPISKTNHLVSILYLVTSES